MESKNWNDLPSEMKLECVKRMDFETKWALRSTSRVEKQLVERTKCLKKLLDLETDSDDSRIAMRFEGLAPSGGKFPKLPIDYEEVESVIRMGYIAQLKLKSNKKLLEIIYDVSRKIPLDVECLCLKLINPGKYLSIVDKCRGLTQLTIICENEFKFSDLSTSRENIFELDVVILSNISAIEPDDVIQLIATWIAADKNIYAKFCVHLSRNSSSSKIPDNIIKAIRGSYEVVEYPSDHRTFMLISFGRNKYICVDVNR